MHVDGQHALHKLANHRPRSAPKSINRSRSGARGRFSNSLRLVSIAVAENALSSLVSLFKVGPEVDEFYRTPPNLLE